MRRAHRSGALCHVRGIAAPTADAFETPLGRVPVDMSALDAIAGLPSVIQDDAAMPPSTLSKLSCRLAKPPRFLPSGTATGR